MTKISRDLSSAIETCLERIGAADGHLPLGYRQMIWAQMGERRTDPGQRRRSRLAIASARYVLPIWRARRPDDNFAERILATAEKSLFVHDPNAGDLADDAWTDLQEYPDAIRSGAAAAVAALHVVLFDEAFVPGLDLDIPDYTEPEIADAAFLASWAAAGGSIWHENADVTARRRFWHWWLTDAVPAAYEAEPA